LKLKLRSAKEVNERKRKVKAAGKPKDGKRVDA